MSLPIIKYHCIKRRSGVESGKGGKKLKNKILYNYYYYFLIALQHKCPTPTPEMHSEGNKHTHTKVQHNALTRHVISQTLATNIPVLQSYQVVCFLLFI